MEGIPAQYVFDHVPGDMHSDDETDEDIYVTAKDEQNLPFLAYMKKNKSGSEVHIEGIPTYFGHRKYRSTIKLEDLRTDLEPVKSKKSGLRYSSVSMQTESLIMSPEQRPKTSSYPNSRKERTPRTLLKMMERHRENERVRHHSLNESMKTVCSYVPGSENLLKETKVVMMQRIIAYICYLENTVNDLCSKIGIKVHNLHLSTNLLTDQWKGCSDFKDLHPLKIQKPKVKHKASRRNAELIERRMKLSSPTIDSTTDSYGISKLSVTNKVQSNSSHESNIGKKTSSPTIDSTTDSYGISKLSVTNKVQSSSSQEFNNGKKTSSPTIDSTTDSYGISKLSVTNKVQSSSSQESNNGKKTSSPTIDSTTDSYGISKLSVTNKVQSNSSQESNNDVGVADVLVDDNACCVPDSLVDTHSYIFQHEDFLPSSTSYDNFPDAFDLMSSPLGTQSSLLSPKVKSIDSDTNEDIGIKSDKRELLDTTHEAGDHEMWTISPECILQTSRFKSHGNFVYLTDITNADSAGTMEDDQIVPGNHHKENSPIHQTPTKISSSGKNKRKQYTPQRSPLLDVSNFMGYSDDEAVFVEPKVKKSKSVSHSSFAGKIIKKDDVEEIVSYVNPYTWKFHNTATTRRQKADLYRLEKPENNGEKTVGKPDKVDHRKTTWMNGFMMFSRLNRRKFIDANPGVHTSSISKMMGHAWRQMTETEQGPFKEKAKDFAEYMKGENLVPDISSTSSDACNDA